MEEQIEATIKKLDSLKYLREGAIQDRRFGDAHEFTIRGEELIYVLKLFGEVDD